MKEPNAPASTQDATHQRSIGSLTDDYWRAARDALGEYGEITG